LLDLRPLKATQYCNDAANDATVDYSEPYAVPLDSATDAATQFIVFDSSRAGTSRLPTGNPMYVTYRAQFERAFAAAGRTQSAFLLSHQPILGLAPNLAHPDAPLPQNAALQSVQEALWPAALFPPSVQALLDGHVNLFEAVGFATPQPAQLIFGNAGAWLDPALPSQLPAAATPMLGAVVAGLVSTKRLGFTTLERDGAAWRFVANDTHGVPMMSCTLVERHLICDSPSLR